MAAPTMPLRLFASVPDDVREAELRKQGLENHRTKVAHNRRPQTVTVAGLKVRRRRRQTKAGLRELARVWTFGG